MYRLQIVNNQLRTTSDNKQIILYRLQITNNSLCADFILETFNYIQTYDYKHIILLGTLDYKHLLL